MGRWFGETGPSPTFFLDGRWTEGRVKPKFSLAFLPLLLALIVPFAAITGCEREETPDGEVQDDRNRADADRPVDRQGARTINRITVGRGDSSAT
jgi:hypothetical protein